MEVAFEACVPLLACSSIQSQYLPLLPRSLSLILRMLTSLPQCLSTSIVVDVPFLGGVAGDFGNDDCFSSIFSSLDDVESADCLH